MDLVDKYFMSLPEGPRQARIAEVERHLADTHFCWIGGFTEESPFYYRVQSPVTFIEFDHHAGVFLTNPEPAKFHVHTIVRTPNGNDYGFDLLSSTTRRRRIISSSAAAAGQHRARARSPSRRRRSHTIITMISSDAVTLHASRRTRAATVAAPSFETHYDGAMAHQDVGREGA